MPGYIYKGNRFDEPDPTPAPRELTPAQPKTPTKLRPCGTPAAYRRHLYNGEQPCPECHTAWTEHHRKRNRARGTKPKQLQPCGTYAAYQRHKKRGEPQCLPCQNAGNQYYRTFRARKKEAA